MAKLDGIRQKVFLDRYALKDKDGVLIEQTPEEMWRRVAGGIASNEKKKDQKKWADKFYDVMADFKFVPGGRILSGAGTDYQVTYFNCFVIPSPKDSREGILDSLKQLVEIQSRSGGVGLNLSSLRPRGARVRKVNGTSSGPVTWAGLFSYATHDVVQQGGTRRGATMLMLWDWHPDVEEFITVKQDLSKINGANLSVCVSDAFMEAVKKDADWDLVYPDIDDPKYDTKWTGEIDLWKKMGGKVKVYKTVRAKELWNLICKAAWRSAEPGLHFLERSNKRSNTYYFERLVATNPSLRAGTRVLTKEGIFPIEKLEGRKFLVKNLDGKWSDAECFLSGRNKELYKITLSNGRELFATAEHKWPILAIGGGFGKVTTNKLQSGNILPFPKAEDIVFDSSKKLSREEGFMVGWLYGDGWISERGSGNLLSSLPLRTSFNGISKVRNFSEPVISSSFSSSIQSPIHNFNREAMEQALEKKKKLVFGFLFSEEEKYLAAQVLDEVNKLKKEKSSVVKARDNTYTIQSTSAEFAENLSHMFGVDKKANGIPEAVWHAGSEFIKGFVDALISSDGFVAKNANRITLTTKHKKMAEDMSSLMSFYGIKSNIRRSEATRVKFPNQKDYSKIYERYDVSIEGHNVINFAKIFTLSHIRKQENLNRIVKDYSVSRNLPDQELVRIQSVEKTDLKEDVWDISVYDDTHCFYMEHCVTGNCGEQPLGPWAVCNLGAMNLAAYVKGGDLANDKPGEFDFENFGKDVQVAMRFLDNVIDKTYYFFPENEKCAKEIRRTGLGIMGLGDTMILMGLRYGHEESLPVIEKIFKILRDNAYESSSDIAVEKGAFPKFDKEKYMSAYHVKALPKKLQEKISKQGIRNAVLLTIAPTGTTSLVSGVSSGIEPVYEFIFKRRWKGGEEIMYHPLLDEWMKAHPGAERAQYFVSANDLTPLDHTKVQAVAQEYIDSSISKTVNAPNSHTVEDVKELYMAAYDMGLKGVTYMRDGSRQGVLERIEPEKTKVVAEQAPMEVKVPVTPVVPRPLMVQGVTYRTESPIGKVYVTINYDEKEEPFEVFINSGKSGSDVMAMADALGRMISFVLRIHSPVSQRERMRRIISELAGIGGSRSVGFGENKVRSLPDALSKTLAKHYGFRVNGKVEDALPKTNGNGHSANGPSNGHTADLQPEKEVEVVSSQLSLDAPIPQESAMQASTTSLFDLCPSCGGGSLAYEEGCKKCYNCGYSEC